MKSTTKRMMALLGMGTVLAGLLLFMTYHYVVGPQGLSMSMPALSVVSTGENKACVECHQKTIPELSSNTMIVSTPAGEFNVLTAIRQLKVRNP